MARMASNGIEGSRAAASAVIRLALVPLEMAPRADAAWSIDQETMGTGWHDSSWLLRRGLDVIEGLPSEALPPEWQWRWWLAAGATA